MGLFRYVCALLLLPGLAWAHAHLLMARPAAGARIAQAPQTLDLTYSEALEPSLTKVAVTDQAGAHFETGGPSADPANPRKISVGLKKLPPGTYTVVWHAVSTDTHKTQGSFRFTVTGS